ncbi:MAG: type I restriction enzyme HsdR N-terminal domain-containing protein [Gammaproteobacteria bacterium]
MARRAFYDVPKETYLFGYPDLPEEQVRQWALFELLGPYGYLISSICTEVKVKVGTRYHRADIVVYQDELPLIVVECKRQEYRGAAKFDQAMRQAQSYATSRELGAEFAVFTNGEVWHVSRRVGTEWLPVTDIPRRAETEVISSTLGVTLSSLDDLRPLLAFFHEAVPDEQIVAYLDCMQVFFHAPKKITEGTSDSLRYALDLLLRALAGGLRYDSKGEDSDYVNLRAAFRYTLIFVADRGVVPAVEYEGWKVNEMLTFMEDHLSGLVMPSRGVGDLDYHAARLALALVQYGWRQIRHDGAEKGFPLVVNEEFFAYLNRALILNFGIALPDRLDEDATVRLQIAGSSFDR